MYQEESRWSSSLGKVRFNIQSSFEHWQCILLTLVSYSTFHISSSSNQVFLNLLKKYKASALPPVLINLNMLCAKLWWQTWFKSQHVTTLIQPYRQSYSSSWSTGIHLRCCCVFCVNCAAGNRRAWVGASASSRQNQLSVAETARHPSGWTGRCIRGYNVTWPVLCWLFCGVILFVFLFMQQWRPQRTRRSSVWPSLCVQHAALTTRWRHNAVSSGHSSLDPDAPVLEVTSGKN